MPNEPAEPLEPGTPLPWKWVCGWLMPENSEKHEVVLEPEYDADDDRYYILASPKDMEYIRVACNNYPRLQAVYNAVTEYRRKERALLKLPDEAREEDHLEAIRHIIFQHKEMNQAYGVLSSNTRYWKEEAAALQSKLSALEEPCVWTPIDSASHDTSCGRRETGLSGFATYCPFCGRKIKDSEHREET